MIQLLFSARGRIGRGRFWLAGLLYLAISLAASVAFALLRQIIPAEDAEGNFSVEGVKAIPYLLLIFGVLGVFLWSGVCVGIKRFHDRDKSGAWILIQFVPLIGPIWYLVEVGFLRGTVGPNRFGPDPLDSAVAPAAYAPAA
ncbi:DUF805 domain-containing protein [Methylobacterium iners]|uniref:DUF805 domain-containing protein n=1 Tax=Methylobacterium iners TaxID=418707 RepID=A0ABQ4RSQ8_9HYPH|nr:DUF805 domain-containing protein [Methylobacterium iners]GJD93815.1 hypothetical protein OCOJLMKI_1013 [Methylobacterium iners]